MQRAGVQGAVCMQVRWQRNVCAWMHAGERAVQGVRMDAVDEQCRSDGSTIATSVGRRRREVLTRRQAVRGQAPAQTHRPSTHRTST